MIAARTDVVGSLFRLGELLRRERGKIDAPEFKWVEDAAVEAAIRLQEDAGLAVVTDGEMRRLSFQIQLMEAVEGFSDWDLDAFLWGDGHGDEVGNKRIERPPIAVLQECIGGGLPPLLCKAAVSEASEESDARVDVGRGWRGRTVIGVVAVSAPPPLSGIFASLTALLGRYGYLVVVGLVITEGFGMPAPGQTMLLAAGLYAGTGQLNIVAVGLLGFFAATVGDNIGFGIGRFGGRRLVLRLGRYVLLTEQRLDKTADVFTRHGGKIVVVARFIDGLRQVNGIIAGLVGMPWWRFLAFNALGAALWVGLWTTVGYLAGNHIAVLYDQFRHYEFYLLTAAVAVTVGLIIRHLVRRRRDHRQAHH